MSNIEQGGLATRLKDNLLRRQLTEHAFFRTVQTGPVFREQAVVLVGQWWHPLHYFPVFLSRAVSILPDIASKCSIARILSQETGDGNPRRAHEVMYVNSMRRAGFTETQVCGASPFEETIAVVNGYSAASESRFGALGFLFATEVADLAMVSGLGAAVAKATGTHDLAWVAVHVEQEPDHVEKANGAILSAFSPSEEVAITNRAEEMWKLWIAFFDRLNADTLRQGSNHRLPIVDAAVDVRKTFFRFPG